jgi:hypothetical protein
MTTAPDSETSCRLVGRSAKTFRCREENTDYQMDGVQKPTEVDETVRPTR